MNDKELEELSNHNNVSVTSSKKRLYTLHSQSQTECDINAFRKQIEKKYSRSTTNQIYAFPLQVICNGFFEEESDQELENADQYDLNMQNKKNKYQKQACDFVRKEAMKKKKYLEEKSIQQKRRIREKSSQAKKKYNELLKAVSKSKKKVVTNFTIEDPKPIASHQKIHRLKTQPDQSLLTTHRIQSFKLKK